MKRLLLLILALPVAWPALAATIQPAVVTNAYLSESITQAAGQVPQPQQVFNRRKTAGGPFYSVYDLYLMQGEHSLVETLVRMEGDEEVEQGSHPFDVMMVHRLPWSQTLTHRWDQTLQPGVYVLRLEDVYQPPRGFGVMRQVVLERLFLVE